MVCILGTRNPLDSAFLALREHDTLSIHIDPPSSICTNAQYPFCIGCIYQLNKSVLPTRSQSTASIVLDAIQQLHD